MTHPNYTLEDLRAGALAGILFASVAFAPGYVIGWSTNVLTFRDRKLSTKLLLATACSIAVSPIACYWIGWLCGAVGLKIFAALSSLGALVLLSNDLQRRNDLGSRASKIGMLIVFGWVLLCVASLVDLQIADRLYFSPVAHDYSIRAAMTDAIGRTGVRPMSPFFLPHGPVPLRYHHFWYILCSIVDQLGGNLVTARQSLIGGAVWAGIGLIAIVPLYLRFFCEVTRDVVQRRSLFGIGLLAVTGLDLIPVLILMVFAGSVQVDMEWWNSPVASWLGSILWAPHYIACLVACLTGFLILWRGSLHWGRSLVLAGTAFASSVGLSVYVSLVFAVFLGVWTLRAAIGGRRKECLMFIAAGAVAVLLALPHLQTLFSPGSATASAPIAIWVRTFRIAEIIMSEGHVDPWRRAVVHLLLLPLNYFLEFGAFAVVAVLTLKRLRHMQALPRHEAALALMATTSLVMATFLRSNVITINDLGVRGILIAQFALLLWTVELRQEWATLTGGVRNTLLICLSIGAAGSLYQAGMLRISPVLADRGYVSMPDWLSADRRLGQRTMAMRVTYSALQTLLPRNAVVQSNPDSSFDDYFFGLYGNRQTAAANSTCDVGFGGSASDCAAVIARISPLFSDSLTKPAHGLEGLDALIFKNTDPAWKNRASWIWRVSPLFENELVRVIPVTAP